MIKAIAEKDGKPLYIFGLSLGNCERLLAGKPILIDLDVMAREIADSKFRGSVMIMGGERREEHSRPNTGRIIPLANYPLH